MYYNKYLLWQANIWCFQDEMISGGIHLFHVWYLEYLPITISVRYLLVFSNHCWGNRFLFTLSRKVGMNIWIGWAIDSFQCFICKYYVPGSLQSSTIQFTERWQRVKSRGNPFLRLKYWTSFYLKLNTPGWMHWTALWSELEEEGRHWKKKPHSTFR